MGYPGDFAYVKCGDCGLVYQYPRLTQEALQAYYVGDYDAYAQVLRDDPSPLRRVIRRYGFIKQRRYVERFVDQGRLLDVGCGTGLFLEEMQRTGRWQLWGVEPNLEAATYVQKVLGVTVTHATFEEVGLPLASFDVVTLWYVLEHLRSPMQALRKVYQLLRPGGFLVFAIPNYESLGRRTFGRFWSAWDLPRHLHVFPRPVLQRMLHDSGFEAVAHRTFLITYFVLGQSLDFWLQDWPAGLQGAGRLLRALYYSPLGRLGFFPFQLLLEWSGLAPITTWAARKVR
jgi:SAM-dependent methyltransferase